MAKRPASEMFEALREMADDLFGDDEQEKETYITEHMKKLGYKMRVVFEDADDDDSRNDGSFTSSIFGSGGQRRERRDVGRERPRDRRASGGFGTGQYTG